MEHISVRSSVFLGLNSNVWVVVTVVDSPGLELQTNGVVFTDKCFLGATLYQVPCWGGREGINQTLMECSSLAGEVYK